LQKNRDDMKKVLLFSLLTVAFLLTGCKYGIKQVPKQVRQAFEAMFPGATHVDWDKEFSSYTADFYHEGHEKEAQFNKDGNWMRIKTELTIVEVPAPVMEAAHEYCDWEIDEVFLYEQANGVATYYVIEFDQDMTPHEKQLHVLPTGAIVTAF
jgi:hypothetical protein